LLFGLGFILKRKLTSYFFQQRKLLEEEIAEAGAEFTKIKSEVDNLEKELSQLDRKMGQLKEESARELERESKRIESESQRTIHKIMEDGEARLRSEVDRSKKALEREIFESALLLSEQALAHEMKKQGQEWVTQMIQEEASRSGKQNYAS
jgi:F0F1-type ATP synthase membrane subunit b/b'